MTFRERNAQEVDQVFGIIREEYSIHPPPSNLRSYDAKKASCGSKNEGLGQIKVQSSIKPKLDETEQSPNLDSISKPFQQLNLQGKGPKENEYSPQSARPVYQYVPLPKGSITRVIVLQPAGKKEDELHCDIQPLNLDDQFYTYDALSYVWGQPVFSDTLYCAGQCIKITPTLSSALRRFRSRTVSRRLWADAVCINQRDNEEKAVQVQEMARIYLRARSVLIYLGEPFRGEENCMRFLLELASLLEQEPHAALVDTPRNDRFIKQTAVAVFGTESLAPIERFTQIPWFRRRWIIQEASLCPVSVVFFGKSMSALSVLSVAMAALWNSTVITHKVNQDALHAILVINHIGNCRERWPGEELAHGIVDLLVACHASESSEHRDRLYALLSVAPDVKKTRNHSGNGWTDINVRVDYKQPLRKLYSDFAHQCLRISPTLDVLHCAGAFISNDPPHRQYSTQYGLMTFPSFVPDWRAQRRYMPFMGVHRFTAGFGDSAPFNEYDRILDDLVLSLPGLQLDKVKIKSDPVLEPLLTEKQVNTLFRSYFSLYRQYLVSKGEEANKKFPLEALAKTLIADHALSDSTILLKGGVNEQGQLRGRDSVKAEIARKALWGGFLSLLKAPGVAESSDKDGLLALNYLKAVCETMQGRCFFILESGHMGIGPSHMEVGDLVVVFFGVRTPFVLHVDVPDPIPRKVQYRLVGDCYVDGFMNGEVFRLPGVKSSSYVIC